MDTSSSSSASSPAAAQEAAASTGQADPSNATSSESKAPDGAAALEKTPPQVGMVEIGAAAAEKAGGFSPCTSSADVICLSPVAQKQSAHAGMLASMHASKVAWSLQKPVSPVLGPR